MSSVLAADLARAVAARLAEAGSATPELDARLLTSFALTGDPGRYVLISRDRLDDAAQARVAELAERRLSGEPVARILGRREFWSRDFELSADTLVPRPDTETLVAAALEEIDRRGWRRSPLRLVDFGTGSGCILVALLCELPEATGIGVDLSLQALRTTRRNADANGLGQRALLVQGDWGRAISGLHDVIVTNPPYIPSEEVGRLSADVARFDPRRALDGGPDGLDAYRALLPDASRLLAPGGIVLTEIGSDQGEAVSRMAGACGLHVDRIARDLEDRERVVVLSATAQAAPPIG